MQKMLMTLVSTRTHVVHVCMYNICWLDNRTGDTDSKVRRAKRERERERERERGRERKLEYVLICHQQVMTVHGVGGDLGVNLLQWYVSTCIFL